MPRTGTGRIYKRGEQWWIDYSHRGKRHREPAGTKSAATKLLKKRIAEMESGTLIGRSEERVTVDDLLSLIKTDYAINNRKSIPRLNGTTAHLAAFFVGSTPAIDVTTDRIMKYIEHRQQAGAAQATIRQELSHLRRAFNLARQARRLTACPYIPAVHVSNTRKGFLEAADLEQVLPYLPVDVRPVVRFAFLTGWRRGEVLPLQWSQVDFAAGEVRLWTSKNDEPRVFRSEPCRRSGRCWRTSGTVRGRSNASRGASSHTSSTAAGVPSSGCEPAGQPRAGGQASRKRYSTISAEAPSATWNGPASPAASP